MSSPSLIDDSDPTVQYSEGWLFDQLQPAVHHTRHGAFNEGTSVALAFDGTGIDVVTTAECVARAGQSTTSYTIDGVDVATVTGSIVPECTTRYNDTVFSKKDLSPGSHVLSITNMNGTSPNIFWIDYFLVYGFLPPEQQESTTTSTSLTFPTPILAPITTSNPTSSTSRSLNSPSTTSASVSRSPNPTSSTSRSFGSPSTTSASFSNSSIPTSSTAQSTERGKAPAVVGGVVASVVLLVMAGILLFLRRGHCRQAKTREGDNPFAASAMQPSIDGSGSGHTNPSRAFGRPFRTQDSPPAGLETFASTVDIDPAFALAASHEAGSDRTSMVMQESTAHSSGQTPLKSLPPDSGREGDSGVPAASSTGVPLPGDIGQALAHASPELQSTALTLIRSLLQRNQSQDLRPQRTEVAEVDSGLRIYNDAYMPPPPAYSAD